MCVFVVCLCVVFQCVLPFSITGFWAEEKEKRSKIFHWHFLLANSIIYIILYYYQITIYISCLYYLYHLNAALPPLFIIIFLYYVLYFWFIIRKLFLIQYKTPIYIYIGCLYFKTYFLNTYFHVQYNDFELYFFFFLNRDSLYLITIPYYLLAAVMHIIIPHCICTVTYILKPCLESFFCFFN
jgi:hypothetical protein